MVTELELLLSGGIGIIGAGAVVFASYLGLSGYDKLTEKLYTKRNLAIYLIIGGLIAGISQLTVDSFAPLQALAIGGGWPAVLTGTIGTHTLAKEARTSADEQLEEIKDVLEATEE